MNLGKLVPLEVHGRVRNAKITKKYFPMSEWGVPHTVGREELSNKLKNTPIGYLVREIRPREVPGLKVGNSRECPGSVPGVSRSDLHDPKGWGVLQRATEAYVWGNLSKWWREAVTSFP